MELSLLTSTIFLAACLVPLWCRASSRGVVVLAVAAPAAAFVWFLCQVEPVASGRFPEIRIPWVPDLGVDFSMRLDGLALLFALLVTGIGVLILVYAAGYFHGKPQLPQQFS